VSKKVHFAEIFNSRKIWAIGSIHSKLDAFNSIKNYLIENFEENDYLVFLGNVIGLGEKSKETLSSVIDLRNKLMGKFLLSPEKIIFLRGAQEEMFLKLLQLQTAPNPPDIVNWIFEHGVDSTIISYGFDKKEIINIASQGALSISKLTAKINITLMKQPGHKEYFANLKHAAFADTRKILFLNRGVDITRPLSAQNDCFWWGYQNFSSLNKPYNSFIRIVRGYKSLDKKNNKNSKDKIVCSLFNQPISNPNIVGGIFDDSGKILDLFESN